jgi:hypothetical protein
VFVPKPFGILDAGGAERHHQRHLDAGERDGSVRGFAHWLEQTGARHTRHVRLPDCVPRADEQRSEQVQHGRIHLAGHRLQGPCRFRSHRAGADAERVGLQARQRLGADGEYDEQLRRPVIHPAGGCRPGRRERIPALQRPVFRRLRAARWQDDGLVVAQYRHRLRDAGQRQPAGLRELAHRGRGRLKFRRLPHVRVQGLVREGR